VLSSPAGTVAAFSQSVILGGSGKTGIEHCYTVSPHAINMVTRHFCSFVVDYYYCHYYY